MKSTSPKIFRAELKDYLNLAEEEPIRIQRRDGGSFILLNEESYEKMILEVNSLQRRLLSMSDIFNEETFKETTKEMSLERFKK